MKRFYMLLLAALLIMTFCACQKTEEAPVETAAPEVAATEVAAPVAEEVRTAQVVETGSGVTVLRANDWADEYPEIYASYMANNENTEIHDYTKDYPMIPIVYEGMAFSKFYGSARGHVYTVEDVTSTGRPHGLYR